MKLKNVSPSNYINFFIDPKYFGSVDTFTTVNYGDYADPAALYNSFTMPGGSQNFDSYDNPQVVKDMNAARGEADAEKRAQDVIAAQKTITDELAWIPLVAPNTVLVMNKKVTGPPSTFSFMFGPWASYLGGRQLTRSTKADRGVRMLAFIVKRLVMLVVTLLVASFLVYGSLYLAPGSPIATLTGGRAPSPQVIAQLERAVPPQRPVPGPLLALAGRGAPRRPR